MYMLMVASAIGSVSNVPSAGEADGGAHSSDNCTPPLAAGLATCTQDQGGPRPQGTPGTHVYIYIYIYAYL